MGEYQLIVDTWESQGEIDESIYKENGIAAIITRLNDMNGITEKICAKCEKAKPKEEFNKNKRYSDGCQSYCKECMSSYGKQWAIENPEKRKSISEKWRKENRELCVRLSTKWNDDNPEQRNKNRMRWNKANPKKVRMMERNQKLRRAGAEGNGVSKKQWDDLMADYNYLCGYCGRKEPLEQDHVVPLSKDGRHEIENVVPSCRNCNASKNNKTLLFFLKRRVEDENSPIHCIF